MSTGKKLLIPVLMLMLLLCVVGTVSAGEEKEMHWEALTTGVDGSGNIITTSVFGYLINVEGKGQIFVSCDPGTGQETGKAFLAGEIVGNRSYEIIKEHKYEQVLDWDNPIEIKPVRVTVSAPNIPTGTARDWDTYKSTGKLNEITENNLTWSKNGNHKFALLVPGADPDYWLMVACLKNPNSVKTKVNTQITLSGFISNYRSGGSSLTKNIEAELEPYETKYVLLNRGNPTGADFADDYGEWDDDDWYVGFSTMRYRLDTKINDTMYPDELRTDGKDGYFQTYVTWNGTNPTIYALTPMRLAYNFQCSAHTERYSRGEGWGRMSGRAEYDPETDRWTVNVSSSMKKSKYDGKYDEEALEEELRARPILTNLFEQWKYRAPFNSTWNRDDPVQVKTGNLIVEFDYIEPKPPDNAPNTPGGLGTNSRWGGWMYTTDGAGSRGFELLGPMLINYANAGEWNWTHTKDHNVAEGTYVSKRTSDPNYYDNDGWMDDFPVVEARPMFILKYVFVPTNGDEGILEKEYVPGYQLEVDANHRPYIAQSSSLLSINAAFDGVSGNKGVYKWTPDSGWELVSQAPTTSTANLWNVKVTLTNTLTGKNPLDVPVRWNQPSSLFSIRSSPMRDPAVDAKLTQFKDLPWSSLDSSYRNMNDLKDAVTLGRGIYLQDALLVLGGDRYKNISSLDIRIPGDDKKRDYSTAWFPNINSYSFNDNIGLLKEVRLGANETRIISSVESKPYVEFNRDVGDVDIFLNNLSSDVQRAVSNMAENTEACFHSGTVFTMETALPNGVNGIIAGAQKTILYRKWERRKKEWRWADKDDYDAGIIGFPSVNKFTKFSYLSSKSPTDGLITRAGDFVLADILRTKDTSSTIKLDNNTPYGSRFWKYEIDGQVNPVERPRD